MTVMAIPPPVLWAQRKAVVFVTFAVNDLKNQKVSLYKIIH